MSPTLTDAGPVIADPSDGLAVMEHRGLLAETFGIPLAVLAELTHRCPLQCPYCSNPVELDRAGAELTTEEWKKVLSELAEIGVLQIHFSGGEPTARKDLVELVQHATDVGLYTNLITSAVLLTKERLSALAASLPWKLICTWHSPASARLASFSRLSSTAEGIRLV